MPNTNPPSKRQQRRLKQRAENPTRACEMRAIRKAQPLATHKEDNHLPLINIGCSGWFYWHWKGKFYPLTLSNAKWFAYYQSHFKTVELNAPFYSWPLVSTVKAWRRQVQTPGFIYTVKVSELITHVKQFVGTKTLINDFYYIGHLLGEQLGCFLFQLPPSYHFTPGRLKRILAQLDPTYRNVVEFRHASWWNETVYAAFHQHNIIFCSSSAPKLPQLLIKTADEVYIRFHGMSRWYKHNYTDEELQCWADKIKRANPKRVWIYFNNDFDIHAVRNANTLTEILKKTLN